MRHPIFLVGALLFALPVSAAPARGAIEASRPRLGVIVVIDQLRADEIEKHKELWTAGFKRLVAEGRWYDNAYHSHGRTETAAGHATIGTGMVPRVHGVVDKDIYDRVTNKTVNLCHIGKEPCSPHILLVPTVGDRLKEVSPKSVVVSMSEKGRAAALLGGTKTDLVAWFNDDTMALMGRASAGSKPVPAWLEQAFHKTVNASTINGSWELPKLPKSYASWKDDSPGERGCGHGLVFPHQLPGNEDPKGRWRAWWCTPQSDEALEALVEVTIDKMHLGVDRTSDLLLVSFGAVDQVGHSFGPNSVERLAVLKSLDETLGRLLHKLETVTHGDVVLMLTADHGVTPTLYTLHQQDKRAGLVDLGDVRKYLEEGLNKEFGARTNYIDEISIPYIYLDDALDAEMKRRVASATATLLRGYPHVARAWAVASMKGDSDDQIERLMYLNSNPERSGDVALVLEPNFTHKRPYYGELGAQHGSPWKDDRQVPVLFWGAGVKQGRVKDEVTVIDAIRTMADRLGIPPDPRGGQPLVQ